jgi:hypothetical protein
MKEVLSDVKECKSVSHGELYIPIAYSYSDSKSG